MRDRSGSKAGNLINVGSVGSWWAKQRRLLFCFVFLRFVHEEQVARFMRAPVCFVLPRSPLLVALFNGLD